MMSIILLLEYLVLLVLLPCITSVSMSVACGLLLLKDEYGILNLCSDLNVCGSHKGKPGTEES